MDKIIFNTKVLDVTLLELAECESTNDMMMQFIRSKTIEEGLLISTNHQKKGRGQRENTWESEKGKNLMMSICLQPTFLGLRNVFYLTMITSLAMVEVLNKRNIEASVKWPNDIYVDDKKICGVLIENILKGSQLVNTIVGVGLNVNQEKFSNERAVSIHQLIGNSQVLSLVLVDFVRSLDKFYGMLQSGRKEVLSELYHRYLYRKGELAWFDDGEKFGGVIQGVNLHGQLEVLKRNEVCTYNLKEIKFI